MFADLKQLVASTPIGRVIQDMRWIAAVRHYKSRLPRQEASKYVEYHEVCRAKSRAPAEHAPFIGSADWEADGYALVSDPAMKSIALSVDSEIAKREIAGTIWTSNGEYTGEAYRDFPGLHGLFAHDAPLARAIRAAFGTEFKIYYCKLYRSRREADRPAGSQLWHSDGGRGTCMNLMFALTPLPRENGAMQLLPWRDTLDVFAGERAYLRSIQPEMASHRDEICAYYERNIEAKKSSAIIQPLGDSGTALLFRNNLIHRGGFPRVVGVERRVIVFHIYPSSDPAALDRYAVEGLAKRGSYPRDPAVI